MLRAIFAGERLVDRQRFGLLAVGQKAFGARQAGIGGEVLCYVA